MKRAALAVAFLLAGCGGDVERVSALPQEPTCLLFCFVTITYEHHEADNYLEE